MSPAFIKYSPIVREIAANRRWRAGEAPIGVHLLDDVEDTENAFETRETRGRENGSVLGFIGGRVAAASVLAWDG